MNDSRTQRIYNIFFGILIVIILSFIVSLNIKINGIRKKECIIKDTMQFVQYGVERANNEHFNNTSNILKALMAREVFEITRGIQDDQDKCIAVAQWISSRISNRSNNSQSLYESFATRTGLCGYRARLFVEILQYLNIPAMVFNIYNYPTPGSGHSCVQAYYQGSWHFFDVTYAGYFKKNDRVLSWHQIMEEAKKGDHLKYLVVFPETLDRNNYSMEFKEDRIEPVIITEKSNNKDRMTSYYSNVAQAKTFGFFKHPTPKKLLIDFDFKKRSKNYSIGSTDLDYVDLSKLARQNGLSINIGLVGMCTDHFVQEWRFSDLEVGKTYTMRLFTYHTPSDQPRAEPIDPNNFYAQVDSGATILEGSYNNPKEKVWTIKFKAKAQQAILNIAYKKGISLSFSCLLINKITINQDS